MSAALRMPLAMLSEDRALQETWRLLEAPTPWVIVLVIAPLVALVSWYAYRSESLPRGVRAILIGLRTTSLCLLLLGAHAGGNTCQPCLHACAHLGL